MRTNHDEDTLGISGSQWVWRTYRAPRQFQSAAERYGGALGRFPLPILIPKPACLTAYQRL
eukprot:4960315-Pyramimonas_sp.AAC.1